NYLAKERIYAGYAMGSLDFRRIRVIGGVRIEGTRSNYTGNSVLFDTAGAYQSTTGVTGRADYTDVLPSVSVRIQADPNTGLRLGYGQAIARPVISDLVPFVTRSDKDQQIAVGNPALKPTRANDFDLLGERYFTSVGVASVGLFYKDLHDPIFPDAESTVTTGPFSGFTQ